MQTVLRASASVLAGLLLTASVSAHGSTYQPPPSTVPGPGTAPPGKGGTPIPDPTKPTYGGNPVATPGNPTATPGGRQTGGVDRTRWTWWWEFNREPYLRLKHHVLGGDPVTGEDGFLGLDPDGGADLRPTTAQIRDEILPALVGAIERTRQPDVVSSALIALGRVGDDLPESDRAGIAERIRPFLKEDSLEVAEAAVIALGILGHEPSAPLLASLLRDDTIARQAVGGRAVKTRMRAFAAYALGLMGNATTREDVRRYAVHELAAALAEETDGPSPDVEVACVIALGLAPVEDRGELPPTAQRRGKARVDPGPAAATLGGQVAFLREVLADKKRDDLVRAHVPVSLARLYAASDGPNRGAIKARLAPDFLARIAPMRREPRELVQSCVIALGFLGDNDADELDAEIRSRLMGIDGQHPDLGVRHFARIALGRCGGRAGESPAEGVDAVRRFLQTELAKGKADERPWAALGLGILERALLDEGAIPNRTSTKALRVALVGSKAPDEIGATALAAGLVRDVEAESPLLDKLAGTRDDEARGSVAVGLGLLGARTAAARVRRVVEESTFRPLLLRDAATGLSLLGDKQAVPALIAMLGDARSLSSQAAISSALGRIGDARSIQPLVEMLNDTNVTDRGRAFAAVALGIVGDTDELPWNTPIAVGVNYHAAPVTLYDDEGLGLLNLL